MAARRPTSRTDEPKRPLAPSPRAATRAATLDQRSSGVLLHPTSLPGPHGCGDLGRPAHAFADWLQRGKQRWWQMLPVGPAGFGNSPYSSLSAFAGNPLLVSLDGLAEEGLLAAVPEHTRLPHGRVDYPATTALRERWLAAACDDFFARKRRGARSSSLDAFHAFRAANKSWLPDYALFRALKHHHGGGPWWQWPAQLRARHKAALDEARTTLADEIRHHEWVEWQFDRQWAALRRHCERLGIALLGDLPIFVAHDSADVWAHPELFFLDGQGQPTVIAGVPPDYFSATGQRWGNPLYRWPALKQKGYGWWIARLQKALERFHAVRLDHFIGFQRYWEIPVACPTAVDGRWVPGPGRDLFRALERALGPLPLVAEDLGAVTDEVKALRDDLGLPGIKVLQFAFGTDPSAPDFRPHHYPRRAVAYTGTHDNDTVMGWFRDRGGPGSTRTAAQADIERRLVCEYLGTPLSGRDLHWAMIRGVLSSVADVTIVPLQDLLGLGSEARMNQPGSAQGNWEWRVPAHKLSLELAARLARLVEIYER